jgi:probable F420-dependent oxidoreductase
MDFGVHLPHLGRGADRHNLARFARRADELGYHSGWVSDHIAWPTGVASKYPYSDTGAFPAPNTMPWLDPMGTLFFAAAHTERLKLGTTVLILPYRPPVQTAKAWATLDVLSEGRAILGVGVGWMKEEAEALGMPFDHRGARSDEQLEAFDALFTQPEPEYHGRFYDFPPLGFNPRPVNGRIPIWVGGDTEPAFRRTARWADCFHAAFTPLPRIKEQWARVQQLTAEAGRDPASITLSVRLFAEFDGNTSDPAKSVQGTSAQIIEQIGVFRDAGASHLLVEFIARGGVGGREEAMERFAAEIMPAFR